MVLQVPLTDPTTQLNLQPGFRFYPTDEELMVQYLYRKVVGDVFRFVVIGDVELYKYDPWELPSKAIFGEKEWYFFSPRDLKYPNGSRPNRIARSGYWKATGTDKVIMSGSRTLGAKKSLVFYVGKAPRGYKTNWIMHEYRLSESLTKDNKGVRQLDDWVLCRIYKKNLNAVRMNPDGPSNEHNHNSSVISSLSSPFDDLPNSHPENKFPNFPTNNPVTTFQEEYQKIDNLGSDSDDYIPKFDSENYDWMNDSAFTYSDPIINNNDSDNKNPHDSTIINPTFNVPDDEVHTGTIRYPTQESSSAYTP